MSEATTLQPCRKCGRPNPPSNEYCAGCGAVLLISTRVMEAQPRAVLPIIRQFELRWLAVGIPVMLGTGTIALVAAAVLVTMVLKWGYSSGHGLSSLASGTSLIFIAMAALAFLAGGALLRWVSRGPRPAEAATASFACALLMGLGLRSLSGDFFIGALLMAVPAALLAALGARLGARTGARQEDE